MTGAVSSIFSVVGGVVAGTALGAAYVRLLALNVALYAGSGPWRRALLLHAARLAMVGLAMWAAALVGAVVLLALLGGFVVARTLMVGRVVP